MVLYTGFEKRILASRSQYVWLYNPARKKGRCPKLLQDWDGPYMIVKPLNDVVYRIQKPGDHLKVEHVDRLAPWNGDHDSDYGLDEDAQPSGGGRATPGPI